jgi:DNA-binding CsgD family transcriptional regulator
MRQTAQRRSSVSYYDPAGFPAIARPVVDGGRVMFGMLSSLALAPTLVALWDELRCFCLHLGCPATGFIDMTGCGRAAETIATTFAIHFSLDDLRQDLAVAAGSAILVDNQTLALPSFGPLGLEAALVVRLAVPECVVPVWTPHLALAFQLAYSRYRQLSPRSPGLDAALSEREREILLWVTRGKSNNVIGSILGISPSTVDTYMRRIFRKLDVADRTSAAMRAIATGIIA